MFQASNEKRQQKGECFIAQIHDFSHVENYNLKLFSVACFPNGIFQFIDSNFIFKFFVVR